MLTGASSTNFPSCGTPHSCPFRLSLLGQQPSLPWVHSQNPMFQHSAAPPHQQTHVSGWGIQGYGMDHPCRSYSVLPDLPTSEGASVSAYTSPAFQFSSRGAGLILFPLFFFLSFILLSCVGIFLIFLGVQGPLLLFSRCSVRTAQFVDTFLMHLWGEVNSIFFNSTILT